MLRVTKPIVVVVGRVIDASAPRSSSSHNLFSQSRGATAGAAVSRDESVADGRIPPSIPFIPSGASTIPAASLAALPLFPIESLDASSSPRRSTPRPTHLLILPIELRRPSPSLVIPAPPGEVFVLKLERPPRIVPHVVQHQRAEIPSVEKFQKCLTALQPQFLLRYSVLPLVGQLHQAVDNVIGGPVQVQRVHVLKNIVPIRAVQHVLAEQLVQPRVLRPLL
mmetsp:Transcript_42295/g.89957  ORF Transcript_42295/g.89957 Transcript_42295/m.89957 type:complete len:223 (+) Transcript_42295:74-742(+)